MPGFSVADDFLVFEFCFAVKKVQILLYVHTAADLSVKEALSRTLVK